MMVAGALFSAEAKPKKVKPISAKARTTAVKKSKDKDLLAELKKTAELLKQYKSEKDKEKKAELKKQVMVIYNGIDTKLAELDPKYKELVDAYNAAKGKSEE